MLVPRRVYRFTLNNQPHQVTVMCTRIIEFLVGNLGIPINLYLTLGQGRSKLNNLHSLTVEFEGKHMFCSIFSTRSARKLTRSHHG